MNVGRVLAWVTSSLALSWAAAQDLAPFTLPPACGDLNRNVRDQTAAGHSKEAESAISAALVQGTTSQGPFCAGLVLSNLAVLMGLSGRFAEAEGFAERSVSILDKVAGPNAQAILRPLQTLAIARLEQGKFGMARSAFKRMQLIPATRPESRARVHGIAAIILEKEGKYTEAESEYLESLSAFEQAGRRNSGDSASNLMGLGSLYIKSGRLDEAARVLDGALTILDVASDAVPMDRLKLLNLRSVLDAREGEWQKAKDRLQRAISIAEHETALEPTFHSMLLANYAQALRKVHQRSEARSVEARAAALRGYRPAEGLVDVTELSAISEVSKK